MYVNCTGKLQVKGKNITVVDKFKYLGLIL
jgi:hypothetical protein